MDKNIEYLEKSDEDLLLLFTLNNNKEALSALFERHMKSAYYLALKYMRNQADAEDVVQKAFINIMRFAKNQNQQGKVRAWIMKSIINTSKNELQHMMVNRKHLQNKSKVNDNLNDQDEVESNELKKTLLSALDELPEHFRVPIWLTHYENMSVKEISDCLGKPERTIRTHLSRGLSKLEEILKHQFSYINSMMIIGVLSECQKADQAPQTLLEKVNAISSIKDSARFLPPTSKSSSFVKLFIYPVIGLISLGLLGFLLFKLNNKSSNITSTNAKDNLIDSALTSQDLELFANFNDGIIPDWCSVISVDKVLHNDQDSYKSYLKSDSSNKIVLNLLIPNQTKPFKVTYELNPKSIPKLVPSFHSISGNKKELITFSYKTLLNENHWNSIQVVVQENFVSTWVNNQLLMVAYSKKKFENDYFIALLNMISKLDNLKIKRIENSETFNFSKLNEIANTINLENPGEKQIQSPIPEINPGPVSVYWGRGQE